jgi:hypothetical protein
MQLATDIETGATKYRLNPLTVSPSRSFFLGGMLHSNEKAVQFVHGRPRIPASHLTCSCDQCHGAIEGA